MKFPTWSPLIVLLLLGACATRTVVVERPRGCPRGAVWIPAHYGPGGHYHPGHYRCR